MKAQVIIQAILEVGTFLLAIIKLKKSKRKCDAEVTDAADVLKNSAT